MEPAAKTPLLHHKLEQIIAAEDLIPGSHDYKEVVELFESFPRDELFQATGRGAPPARRRPAAAREARRDPRPGAQGSVRAPGLDRRRVAAREVQRVAPQAPAGDVPWRGSTARRSTTTCRSARPSPPASSSRSTSSRARRSPRSPTKSSRRRSSGSPAPGRTTCSTTWSRSSAPSAGPSSPPSTDPRFPDYYKTTETDWEQVGDRRRRCWSASRTAVDGFVIGICNEATGERLTRVKLYKTGGKVDLSAFMPLLESLGLRAVEEMPDRRPGRGHGLHPRLRRARRARRGAEPRGRGRPGARGAHRDVAWGDRGRLAEPPRDLRGTVVAPGADPARLPQVPDARVDALHRGVPQRRAGGEPPLSRARSWSCSRRSSTRSANATPEAIEAMPRSRSGRTCRTCRVARPGHDHPLARSARSRRRCARTPTSRTARRSSFKLRSADVPEMPKPFPLFEIFVYSPQMEAIHLRGGMVARGGIRWSDRKEDYRTEVLGPHEGPEGEERGDRAGRLEGRLHPEALDVRPDGARAGGRDAVRHVHARAARHHRQPRRRRGRSPRGRACARRRRSLPGRRGRQGHGDVLRHRQRGRRGVRLLAGRRVRVGRQRGV